MGPWMALSRNALRRIVGSVSFLAVTVAAGGVARAQTAIITTPTPPPTPTSPTTFKNGTAISVSGEADGAGFQNFVVDWAAGLDPATGFQTAGVTLMGGGTTAVSNGTLATWETSSINNAGFYTVRLTVTTMNGTAQALTMVYLEPDLLSAQWPQYLDQGTYLSAGAVPAENADGTTRLVAVAPFILGTGNGEIWSSKLTGGGQTTPLAGRGSAQQPAVADLDGSLSEQAVIADSGNIEIVHPDNSISTLSTSSLDYERNQVIVEDLLGDSHWEILGLGTDFNNQVAQVSAWKPDGTLLNSNFPIQIADQNPMNTWGNRNRVLVGDLNGDGKKEIVVQEGTTSNTFALRLFASDGTPLTWNVPVMPGIPEAMAAADLDHNGKLEIILVNYNGSQALVHVFQPDGSERAGWPATLPNPNANSESFLAVGDLNQDKHYEIVYSHETQLYVFKDDGTLYSSAWPLGTTSPDQFGYGAVVIGDVDGDGFPEIVTTLNSVTFTNDPFFTGTSNGAYYDEQLLAIRRDGTISKTWELTAGNGLDMYVYPAPAIGDFNKDGMTKIAVSYEVTGSPTAVPGVVTVLNTGASFSPQLNDWPLVRQNARNSSVLYSTPANADFALSTSAEQTVTAGAAAQYTIGVTPNPGPYNYNVTGFNCSGLPAQSTCTFDEKYVTPGDSGATVGLMIGTTARTMAQVAGDRVEFGGLSGGLAWLAAILLGAVAVAGRKTFGRRLVLAASCAAVVAVCCVGCGGGPTTIINPVGTPAGTYTITVSATGNAATSHTATVVLVVR